MTDQPFEHFVELLDSFDDAMLVTQAEDGRLRARPMRIAERQDDCALVFVTSWESGKVDEIREESQVNVNLQGGGKYLSLSGTAVLNRDKQKIAELWNKTWEVWFPEGKDDPEITLIRVVPAEGEYWDMSDVQGLKFLIQAGKAWLSGEKLHPVGKDLHGKVEME